MKKHKIGKSHEASVQRFCQGSSQLSYLFFGKFESLPFEKQYLKGFYVKGFNFSIPPNG